MSDARLTFLVKLKATLKKQLADTFKVMVSDAVKQKRASAQQDALDKAVAAARAEASTVASARGEPQASGVPSFIARMLG